MTEIELSIMSRRPATLQELSPLLEEFEAQNRIRVRVDVMEWDTAWAEVLKMALHQHGPDVSEIGTTWLGSLVGMDALEPFSSYETAAIGEPSTFIPSTWESGMLAPRRREQPARWAIPWWADTRLLHYRRDLLEQAGIDEGTAFQGFEQLEQTLDHLADAGIPIPWVIPTHRSRMTIHNMASWVWHAGGRFISGDGRRVLFHQPQARAGIRAYLALAHHLAEPARNLDDTASDNLFSTGQAAITISGPWLPRFASPEVADHLGLTLPPGIPFVGGSHLVCWRHAGRRHLAVKLVRFLTSHDVQSAFGQRAGLLPTRLDVLSSPPFAGDPLYQVATEGLKRGRSFPPHRLWGLIEDKLNEALGRIWSVVLSQPDLDLEQVLIDYLDPMAYQLDAALNSSR